MLVIDNMVRNLWELESYNSPPRQIHQESLYRVSLKHKEYIYKERVSENKQGLEIKNNLETF